MNYFLVVKMGSIAQEMGHDLTIMYFIDKILKLRRNREDFFIVHPAMGPKRDIHYWDLNYVPPEYTSGWDTSRGKFIPEYFHRIGFPEGVMEELNKESKYWDESWYKSLSNKLNEDLKQFSDNLCNSIEELIATDFPKVDKLPDFIGIKNGKLSQIGEVKFEYLPKRALNEFLAYKEIAQKNNIAFYLIFPKKGFYASTDYGWLKKNLPKNIEFYAFGSPGQEGKQTKPILIPNYDNINFKRWKPK